MSPALRPSHLASEAYASQSLSRPKKEAGPSGGWRVLANEPTTEATLLGESWPGKLRSADTDLFLPRPFSLHLPAIFLNNLFVGSIARRDRNLACTNCLTNKTFFVSSNFH